jgi:hypothetical protein
MATGNYFDDQNDPNDPLSVVQRINKGQSAGQALRGNKFTLPAVSQLTQQNRNTSFSRNAPINTPSQNNINVVSGSLNQIPVGGFGFGFGYPRSPQPNIGNFLNQGQQQPYMTGYHWTKGTGGVAGGNNDLLRQYMSNGTMKSFTGGVQDNQPLPPTQYAAPLLNGERSPFSDPSVNALAGAQRSTNQYGQNVINPVGGGQIISGAAGSPSYGSLQGSTPAADLQNRPGLNTPSGGQAFAGPSLRKPMDKLTVGQTWLGGGNWY